MNKKSLVLSLLLSVSALVHPIAPIQPDIFQAIASKKTKAITTCLESSSSAVLSRNTAGQSVLHVAVAQKNLNLILKLIKSGAQVNALDAAGKTALDYAVEMKAHKIVYTLVKFGGKVSSQDNAVRLKSVYKSRAVKFFVAGVIFTPFLWIGTLTSLNNAADVMILTV